MASNGKPSLEDYTAFHGMLCGPMVARRCLLSFEDGTAMFIDQDRFDGSNVDTIGNNDFNAILFPLNVLTYYVLVLSSLTGLCTLLGCTRVIEATEYVDGKGETFTNSHDKALRFKRGDKKSIESSKSVPTDHHLRLPPEVIEYVTNRSSALGPVSTKKNAIQKEVETETNAHSVSGDGAVSELTLIRRFEYNFGGHLSVMMLHFLCTNGRTHLAEIYRIDKRTTTGMLARILMDPLYRIHSVVVNLWPSKKPINITKKTI